MFEKLHFLEELGDQRPAMTFMKMRVSITREQSKKKSRNGGKASGLQDLKKAATLYIFGYFGSVPLVENRKVRSHLDIL